MAGVPLILISLIVFLLSPSLAQNCSLTESTWTAFGEFSSFVPSLNYTIESTLVFLEDGNFSLDLLAADQFRQRCLVTLLGEYTYNFTTQHLSFAPVDGSLDYDISFDPQGGNPILCSVLKADPPPSLVLQNTTLTFASDCEGWSGDFGGDLIVWAASAMRSQVFSSMILVLLLSIILLQVLP